MRLVDAPVTDVRPLLRGERGRLIGLLRDLDAGDWARPTICPGWTVKDVALHIVGDDLSLLSIARDRDTSGLLPRGDDLATFVAGLNQKNETWVEAARHLSRPIICGLLEWTGHGLDVYYEGLDLRGHGSVAWASSDPVPMWFDIAQDLTEHWLHHQQIREAVGRHGLHDEEHVRAAIHTMVWAVPHHYRSVSAPAGTQVAVIIEGPGGGEWSLTRGDRGWELAEAGPAEADARIVLTSDDAWRLLSGASPAGATIRRTGDPLLTAHFMSVRSFLV
jgi:uncharacterized protein (TIGR03083 family)